LKLTKPHSEREKPLHLFNTAPGHHNHNLQSQSLSNLLIRVFYRQKHNIINEKHTRPKMRCRWPKSDKDTSVGQASKQHGRLFHFNRRRRRMKRPAVDNIFIKARLGVDHEVVAEIHDEYWPKGMRTKTYRANELRLDWYDFARWPSRSGEQVHRSQFDEIVSNFYNPSPCLHQFPNMLSCLQRL